jgi:predicted nuclease with RNAse H fold
LEAVAPDGRRGAAVGIDVAEPRKGLDLVALDQDRAVVQTARRLTVDEAVALVLELRPAVVCVDSPSGWSTSGPSRLAERRLAGLRIQSYRTGPDPGDHPFYRWMRVGFEVYRQLAKAYPRYRGGDPTGTAAEVFPHATACLLAGTLRPSGMTKERFRRAILDQHGVREGVLTGTDQVDAALGALTGLIALHGGHSAVGDPDEGLILLPVRHVPGAPLARPAALVQGPAGTRR